MSSQQHVTGTLPRQTALHPLNMRLDGPQNRSAHPEEEKIPCTYKIYFTDLLHRNRSMC